MKTLIILLPMLATLAFAEDKPKEPVAPVTVITRKDIDRSGGFTLAQVLRRVPSVVVTGR